MQQILFPDYMTNDRWPLDIRIYSDEIKVGGPNALGERWMYIGFVAIPAPRYDHALTILQTNRDDVGYEGEVHFTSLRNYSYAHDYNKKTLLE